MCVLNCGNCESCSENILTSEIISDVVFGNIVVPAGSTLNDVLILLETYVDDNTQSVTLTITEPNNLGLVAGTYSMQQVVNAINTVIGTINSDIDAVEANVATLQGQVSTLEDDSTALQAITPLNVQRYKVDLSQTSTNEPVANQSFIDDIGGVWSYVSPGLYYYTKTGAFPDNSKIFVTLFNKNGNGGGSAFLLQRDTTNRLVLSTNLLSVSAGIFISTPTNGLLTNASLLIEVYP